MKRQLLPTAIAITALLFVSVGCDSEEPQPPATAQQSQRQPVAEVEPEPPPAPEIEFPVEENALASVKAFEVMPAGASFIVACGNANTAWELLDGGETDPIEFPPDHGPELLDLNPNRLEGAGLDTKRPVGIVMYGEVKKPTHSDQWVVFATLADEAKFRKAFNLGEKNPAGMFPLQFEDDKRLIVALDNDEVVIASKVNLFAAMGASDGEDEDEKDATLADDLEFRKLVNALDYGAVATAYIATKRGTGVFGVGIDEKGMGVKALAEDELFAARLRMNFAEYAAALKPQVPYLNRVINLRGELHASGRQLRQQIDAIERAPYERRYEAAGELLSDVEEIGTMSMERDDGFSVSGKRWSVTAEDVAAAYQRWIELGLTPDEIARRENLRESLVNLEVVSEMDIREASAEITRQAREGTLNPEAIGGGGAMVGVMTKVGSNFFGGVGDSDSKGGKGGKGGKKGGGGAMGMMSNLGGILGGGGEDSHDIIVRSSDAALRRHMKRRLAPLSFCWARTGSEESEKIKTDIEVDVTGKLTIHWLRGAPTKSMGKCIRDAIGTRGPKPDPPESPDVGIQSRRAVVSLQFVKK